MIKHISWNELYAILPKSIKDIFLKLRELKEDPRWHPEEYENIESIYPNTGGVLNHIKKVYDKTIAYDDIDLCMAALFHDLGKAECAKLKPGTEFYTSHGHEMVSAKITYFHKDFIELNGANYEAVHFIVSNHMRAHKLSEMRPFKQKLLRDNPYFEKLMIFEKCDDMIN